MTATSTIERSTVPALAAFGSAAASAAADATAILRLVAVLNDGNDYGRYSAVANPLVPPDALLSFAALMAWAGAARAVVAAAVAGAAADAFGDPAVFAADIAAIVAALLAACADPADAVRILAVLAGFDYAPPAPGSDAIGSEIATLTAGAAKLMRRSAGIGLARALRNYTPSSQQDAAAQQSLEAGILDGLAVEAADGFEDAVTVALDALRSAGVADLEQRGADLAPVVTMQLPAPLPAEVVAYRLYRDAKRAPELVTRNDPAHPSFLPLTIEALAS